MVCRQRRIIHSPVFEIVKVPLRYRQLSRDLHPVSLSLVIAVYWRVLEASQNLVETASEHLESIPEYPQSPAAHLKRPTAMRINGRISHCDTELLAGQKKAANG